MASNTYSEKLKDPRWQKKRLEVMERDHFQCQSCFDDTSTLNVHHRVAYRNGDDPWEYELDELVTLCEDCHRQISDIVQECVSSIKGICRDIDSAKILRGMLGELLPLDIHDLIEVDKYVENLINRAVSRSQNHE